LMLKEDFALSDVTGVAADRADIHAGGPVRDHEHAEAAAAAPLTAGAGEHEAVARDPGMARPDLVAADHVVVAVAPRFRLQREEVGAGAGLAVSLPERRLAAGDRR